VIGSILNEIRYPNAVQILVWWSHWLYFYICYGTNPIG